MPKQANANPVSLPGLPDVDLSLDVDRRSRPVSGGTQHLSGVAAGRADVAVDRLPSVERLGGTPGPEADNPQL